MSTLISLDEVRAYLPGNLNKDPQGRTSPFADDLIMSAIKAVSTTFINYTGSPVLSGTYSERYNGCGNTSLILLHQPVLEVTALYDSTDWVFDSSTLIDTTEYYYDEKAIYLNSTYFYEGIKNVRVDYSAGYASVPSDLKHACAQEVLRVLNRNNDIGITSRSKGEVTISFLTDDFLPTTQLVLDRYYVRYIS